MAQILVTVGKEMHKEFEIDYMKKNLAQCGLVYYGCCEPLDTKIDIVKKISNLRKISPLERTSMYQQKPWEKIRSWCLNQTLLPLPSPSFVEKRNHRNFNNLSKEWL